MIGCPSQKLAKSATQLVRSEKSQASPQGSQPIKANKNLGNSRF
ncbi:hypothetical protein [Campylobacter sp.]|nr:hypothetical protein [Campylobacter sp.]